MPGPVKPYDETKMGEYVRRNYEFLENLYNDPNSTFRQELWDLDEAGLRGRIETLLGLIIPANVRIMVVDLEQARVKPTNINPQTDSFYTLVLPPVPRRKTSGDYKEMAAWEGAWHHAIVDGYGM